MSEDRTVTESDRREDEPEVEGHVFDTELIDDEEGRKGRKGRKPMLGAEGELGRVGRKGRKS